MMIKEIEDMKKELIEYGLEKVVNDIQELSIAMLYKLIIHDTEWVEVNVDNVVGFTMMNLLIQTMEEE